MITNDLFRDTQNSKLYISKLTPEFLRSSISNYSKYENARSQTPLVQLLIAESLKASGNRLYKSGMLRDALNVYQEAISIFRYLVPTNLRWKDEGLKADEIELVDRVYELSKKVKDPLETLLVSLYLNIAACTLKLSQPDDCIRACVEAIEIDHLLPKALRALAYIRISETTSNKDYIHRLHRLAETDLLRAQELSPQDIGIKKELSKLRNKLLGPNHLQKHSLPSPTENLKQLEETSMLDISGEDEHDSQNTPEKDSAVDASSPSHFSELAKNKIIIREQRIDNNIHQSLHIDEMTKAIYQKIKDLKEEKQQRSFQSFYMVTSILTVLLVFFVFFNA